VRRLSRYPDAETRASMDAGPCRNMGRDLLFATCGAPPVVGPRVVDTAEPGVARSDECREGVTGGYRTHQETHNFRKHVSALCAAQTCYARGKEKRGLL
jgi:hypothetical protein